VYRKIWIEIVRNLNICGYQMKVMLKKTDHIVECVKNVVKKEVYMWKKTLTFSINIFYVVVVGLITNDIIKDIQIQNIIQSGKTQNIKVHIKKNENK
jgi:hypothetical protein